MVNIHTYFSISCVFLSLSCSMQPLTTTNHLDTLLCYWCVVSGVWWWQNNVPPDLPLFCLLSLRDLMRHWHTCKPSPAGLLLISRPPCESTLSLSLLIILGHYWLLMCLSTHPQISNVIMKRTNTPLFLYLVITASDTPLICVILFSSLNLYKCQCAVLQELTQKNVSAQRLRVTW